MKERVWPTEQQYFDGVMDDGSKPPIHSDDFFDDVKSGRKRFLHPAEIPPPGMRGKDPADMTEAELLMQIDLQEYRAINQACNYAQSMIKMGEAALNAGTECTKLEPGAPAPGIESNSTNPKQTTGEHTVNNIASPDTSNNDAIHTADNNNPAPESPNNTGGGNTKPSTGQGDYNLPDIPDLPELQDLPKNPYQLRRVRTWKDNAEAKARKQREAKHKQVKDDVLREVAGDSTAAETATARTAGTAVSREDKPLTRTQMIIIGERGARLMLKLAPARAEIARRLVEYAKKLDTKDEFLNNRAVAVVKHTLLAMDEAYEDIGFAGWMPFRAIDQWLMFCGVLQRVLAANGLIHSEHAEVYRKLMEETPPPIEPDWRTPQSWGKCYVNRAFRTMDYLKETIQLVDEGRPPP